MKIDEERRAKLVDVLADVFERLCERNDRLIIKNTPVTRFHALRPPQITIKFYLKRIAKHSSCSEECFVLALIYIDRLINTNSNFLVNSLNVHRIIITSVMVGAKFFDDQYFNNTHFAKVGGISVKEMNLLEIEFLFMINLHLFVETDVYKAYNERLMTCALVVEECTREQVIGITIGMKKLSVIPPSVSNVQTTTSMNVSKQGSISANVGEVIKNSCGISLHCGYRIWKTQTAREAHNSSTSSS